MRLSTTKAGKVAKQRAFLEAFAACASVAEAAAAVKIDRKNHYQWLEDPAYADRFAKVQDQAAQELEDEAVRRAKIGVLEYKFYQGQLCYKTRRNPETQQIEHYGKPLAVRRFSDTLLALLLRGARPQKYRESCEVTGKDGGPILAALTVTFVKPE